MQSRTQTVASEGEAKGGWKRGRTSWAAPHRRNITRVSIPLPFRFFYFPRALVCYIISHVTLIFESSRYVDCIRTASAPPARNILSLRCDSLPYNTRRNPVPTPHPTPRHPPPLTLAFFYSRYQTSSRLDLPSGQYTPLFPCPFSHPLEYSYRSDRLWRLQPPLAVFLPRLIVT
jgi:hypothetical protein